MYDSTSEPVVRPDESRLPPVDLSGYEFEVAAPNSEEECEKKSKKKKK